MLTRSKTAENANMGQAGVYILHDEAEEELGLPSGYGEYDIPLVLTSKIYNEDGTLVSLLGEEESVWGDIIHVVSRRAAGGLVSSPTNNALNH